MDALERTLEQKVPGPGAGLAGAAGDKPRLGLQGGVPDRACMTRLAQNQATPCGPGFALLPASPGTAACLPSFIPCPHSFVRCLSGT